MLVINPDGSVNSWLDQLILPGRLYKPTFDPEGVLCSISAIAITLTGAITGNFLRNENYTGNKKTMIIAFTGVVFLIFGFLLSPFYPIIKKAWTTTFNLTAGGISLILMAAFYWLIDVKKIQKWTLILRVIGLNSITIYLLNRIISFRSVSEFFFEGIAKIPWLNHQMVIAIGILIIEWGVLYYLYKKNIFLRV